MDVRQMGGRSPRRFSVMVQRLARPPMPWAWAIYGDGVTDPYHCSSRFYRSAEEAWAVGRAMLTRITSPNYRTITGEERTNAPEGDPISS